MTRRICAVVAAGMAAALAAGGSAKADCKVGRIAELPVTMKGLRPLVPAEINGADVMLIPESGSFFSSLAPSTATDLKLPHEPLPSGYTVNGVGGSVDASLTTVKVFTLASAPLKNVQFLIVPGAGLSGQAAGQLGQNVLGLADAEYDLAHGVIRLMKPVDCGRTALVYWEPGKSFSTIEIEDRRSIYSSAIIGSAFVNETRLRVKFDSAGGLSMMTRAAARRVGLTTDSPEVRPGGMDFGIGSRSFQTWIATVASFKIGDEEIRNTKIRIGDFTQDDADMLIGTDFFLSHRIYVANSQRRLYFTYNGGPVFNLAAPALAQNGPGAAPTESLVPKGDAPDPKDAEGFSRRGAALASRHEFERAIADFDRACAMDPKEANYFYQRGMAHWQNKQPFLAMADFDAALRLKPGEVDTLMAQAELKLQGHDKDGAVSDIDAAAAAVPRDADVRLRLARLYGQAERFDASIAQFDQWIPTHRDEALMVSALNGRCWDRAVLGRELDQALKDCDRAVGWSKNGDVLDSRGMVHLRRGELDKAIADYDAALALNPKLAWSLYGRGLAKQRTGQQAEGQKDINAALALRPELPKLAKSYGILEVPVVAIK